jgi:hypothetical protein
MMVMVLVEGGYFITALKSVLLTMH